MTSYKDNAIYPIIAIDFDDTINVDGSDTYPRCGRCRIFARGVINFLHKLGVKVIIWTSRDVAYNQEEKILYDHLTPMIKFLDDNGIQYDTINESIQFAPYHYNGRKIYAHMYVDDRSYGWDDDDHDIFLSVLRQFLSKVCGMSSEFIEHAVAYAIGELDPDQWMIDAMKSWKVRQ